MAEVITKTVISTDKIIQQCDIFRNVEFIEYAKEENDTIEVSKIIFPTAMVLTQACDLQQDFNARNKDDIPGNVNQDKYLISVIVAPMYNFEDFRNGNHLKQLNFQMEIQGQRSKSKCKNIISNENKRYHYLNFGKDVGLVESVIDFKHYFTVTINYLNKIYEKNYVCSVDSLYRELILQRFANFLSRIGLPEPENTVRSESDKTDMSVIGQQNDEL